MFMGTKKNGAHDMCETRYIHALWRCSGSIEFALRVKTSPLTISTFAFDKSRPCYRGLGLKTLEPMTFLALTTRQGSRMAYSVEATPVDEALTPEDLSSSRFGASDSFARCRSGGMVDKIKAVTTLLPFSSKCSAIT